MSDDWRVHARLGSDIGMGHLLKGLHEREFAHEAEQRLGGRLPVTAEGRDVFVYSPDRAQAETAATAMGQIVAEHGLEAEVSIAHWHPVAEEWRDPDEPLPATAAAEAVEHDEVERREAAESAALGSQWEVRIDSAEHADAVALTERLESEGLAPQRRWKHVFLFADTEDEANALADRLRGESLGAENIVVEGAVDDPWRTTHPYAVLGGLAG